MHLLHTAQVAQKETANDTGVCIQLHTAQVAQKKQRYRQQPKRKLHTAQVAQKFLMVSSVVFVLVTHRIGGLENSFCVSLLFSFCYTPHRWLRNYLLNVFIKINSYTPHRWLRKFPRPLQRSSWGYTPHRWLRNCKSLAGDALSCYTPHRWLRNSILSRQ